jgi:hypothetical protein
VIYLEWKEIHEGVKLEEGIEWGRWGYGGSEEEEMKGRIGEKLG